MNIQTVKFVKARELFTAPVPADLWGNHISDGNLDVSFGDASHTLLTVNEFIAKVLNRAFDHSQSKTVIESLKVIHYRLGQLPADCFIDMECGV